MSKLDFSRNRAPIGGQELFDCPASWRAGHRCDCCVHWAVKRMACAMSTTAYGMPYGGRPKSGWSFVVEAAIEASQVALMGLTGAFEMSVFQMSLRGNSVQSVPGTGRPGTDAAHALHIEAVGVIEE